MVMSSLLTIVARILLLDQMIFIQILQEINVPHPLDTILDIWIKKMPLIGQPDKRKLMSKCDYFSMKENNLSYQKLVVAMKFF